MSTDCYMKCRVTGVASPQSHKSFSLLSCRIFCSKADDLQQVVQSLRIKKHFYCVLAELCHPVLTLKQNNVESQSL